MRYVSTIIACAFVLCMADREVRAQAPDPYQTPGPGTSVQFGPAEVPAVPADFFGPGSDPFTGSVGFEGGPGDVDTQMQRGGPIDCPGAGFPRPCDPVSVEIVQLDLVALSPITVTFNGGQNPEEWAVALTLTPGPQPVGTLNAVLEQLNGGNYTSNFSVNARFVFTKIGGGPSLTLDQGQSVGMSISPSPWSVNVDPGLNLIAPNDGDFVAGVLNGNTVVSTQVVSDNGGVIHTVEPPVDTTIPTISEWGMMVMFLGLLAAAAVVFRRRAATLQGGM